MHELRRFVLECLEDGPALPGHIVTVARREGWMGTHPQDARQYTTFDIGDAVDSLMNDGAIERMAGDSQGEDWIRLADEED